MELIILIVVMVLLFWFMNRGARKAQQAQIDQRNEALVVGNNVVTQAGFLGRIVDIDGDAVTLESPSGEESVWLRTAIVAQMDIPLGNGDQDDFTDQPGDLTNDGQITDSQAESAPGRIANTSPFDDEDDKSTENK